MTVWNPTDDGHADIVSHDTYVNGVPHNTFARLRREDPLSWTEWDGGKPFWSVTRNADISAMNRQGQLFSDQDVVVTNHFAINNVSEIPVLTAVKRLHVRCLVFFHMPRTVNVLIHRDGDAPAFGLRGRDL